VNTSDLPRPPRFRGRFLTDPRITAAYSEGAGPLRIVPSAVAIPEDVADLRALIQEARERGYPLTPRGAGSGMPGGNIGPGIIVDLRRFNRPLYVSAACTANVGAAVLGADLARAAGHLNLRLPPDPSSAAFCTLGGMVATDAAGPRSLRYGSIRRWVRGIEFVTADGEVSWIGRSGARHTRHPDARQYRHMMSDLAAVARLTRDVGPELHKHAALIRDAFPRTTKNTAGYALAAYLESEAVLDLIIGSEGTLGFITRVELALEVEPTACTTLLLGLADDQHLDAVVAHLRALDPSAVEFMDHTLLALVPEGPLDPTACRGAILADFERAEVTEARAAVAHAAQGIQEWCTTVTTALTPEDRDGLWAFRRAASSALAGLSDGRRSLQIIEDGCVPLGALGDYLGGIHRIADDLGIAVVAFGHAGDGHLHVNALVRPEETELATRLDQLFDQATALVIQLGGTTSGEHGDGRIRTPALARQYPPPIIDLFRAVKQAFDPDGLFNPGVIMPDHGTRLGDHLKIGSRAALIPADIAEGLQTLERERGWARPKTDLAEPEP